MADKEYIEREKFKNILESKAEMAFGTSKAFFYSVVKMLELIPAANVVEVKHGYWKEGHYEGGLLDGVNFDKCNICGYERLIEDVKYKTTYKYCPNCGAKMDGKGD